MAKEFSVLLKVQDSILVNSLGPSFLTSKCSVCTFFHYFHNLFSKWGVFKSGRWYQSLRKMRNFEDLLLDLGCTRLSQILSVVFATLLKISVGWSTMDVHFFQFLFLPFSLISSSRCLFRLFLYTRVGWDIIVLEIYVRGDVSRICDTEICWRDSDS